MPEPVDLERDPLRRLTPVVALLGVIPVAPVLAWSSGVGPFRAWFLAATLPACLGLALIGLAAAHYPAGRLRSAMVAGTWGGLAGTVGYDLFRIPFAAQGRRVFAPIDSYGVLLLGADSSSPLTAFAGWTYHVSNGIGFGIAFAVVALGHGRWWAVAWAMVLETATVVTPFADVYKLRGNWDLIAIAYAAHVAYGYPLGRAVERGRDFTAGVDRAGRRTTTWALVAVVLLLVGWHRPFTTPRDTRAGQSVAPGPSAVVVNGKFRPEWLRVPRGGCAVIRNADATTYVLSGPAAGYTLSPGTDTEVCFAEHGVFRVRTSTKAYSGGFVIVDGA